MEGRSLAVAFTVSAIAAAVLTWIFYPGVLYTDSYARWDTARGLLGDGPRSGYLSIAPSLWMAATWALMRSYAAYTALQAFLFFFSTLLVLHRCAEVGWGGLVIAAAVLAVVPISGGYAVYHEAGVGAVIALNFLLVLLVGSAQPATAPALALHAVALFLCVFNLVGFRQNALTVVPVLLWLAVRPRVPTRVAVARCTAILVALAALAATPRLLRFSEEDARSVGPAWEIAQTLQRLGDPRLDGYLDYVGNTRRALASPTLEDNIWDGLFAPGALDFGAVRDPGNAARIRRDYLALIRAHPAAWLATKWHVTKRNLGIGKPLLWVEFDEDRLGLMPQYGWVPNETRHWAIAGVGAFMARMRWLRRPWIVLAVTAAVLLIGTRLHARRVRFARVAFLVAALYYGAFLVTTQSYEFRYFFPSLSLCVLALVSVLPGRARADRMRPSEIQALGRIAPGDGPS